jgi:glycosyltransferase involved in cell wall biosynthesis
MATLMVQSHEPQEMTQEAPPALALSVVVIGRNEGQRLARCLESVRAIRGFGEIELIYVDSASTDGSPELAQRYGAEVIVVHPERPTAAVGRNAGWRRATSEMVLFLDGDTVVNADFPRAAIAAMDSDPRLSTVWGNLREIMPRQSIYNRALDLDWIYPIGIIEACGGNVLMRRSAIEKAGGFDDRLIAGEEPELCRRLRARGYLILHIDHPMALHDLAIKTWRQYWRRARRSGYAYAEVSDRFRNSEDPMWSGESRRTAIRAVGWSLSLVAALAAGPWFGVIPFALWLAAFLLAALRSAWKARWKEKNAVTLFLYGVHSQLQHVPSFVGQLQYFFDKKYGRRRHLIEYK